MEQKLAYKTIMVDGMSCISCENRIENTLKKISGIIDVEASYSKSKVRVKYDINTIRLMEIVAAIEKLDYKVIRENNPNASKQQGQSSLRKNDPKSSKKQSASDDKMSINQLIGIGIIIVALYLIIKNTIGFNFIPQVNQNMGIGILFVVGLLTSLHCIAMCGGINLSQCVSHGDAGQVTGTNKLVKLKPSFLYNSGRVVSYTIIGGIVGALGSIVSFSGSAKGVIAIFSGIFMVIMGLNMLNIAPKWLRKLNPHMPKIFGKKINSSKANKGPFIVGLLNGLMPCGPLQAMQLYALGTGSFYMGALSMFVFSLGTVPLMFGFGALSTLISGKFTHKMMKVSAVLVMGLGLIMVSRGLNLSGINVVSAFGSSGSSAQNVAKVDSNVQNITTQLESGNYTPITVQKGIPVKWDIQATQDTINGCNQELMIPKFGITKTLVPGDNIIEFTPQETGNIPYTCWMGMISSTITVVDDVSQVPSTGVGQSGSNQQPNNGSPNVSSGGGCCGGSSNPQFAGGNIPTDNIQVAKIVDGSQEVLINVNNQGYSPAVVVIQKGIKANIKFVPQQLSSCNGTVSFPQLGDYLSLSSGQTTETIDNPSSDLLFQCSMAMLHGYVKVVDDINNVDLNQVKQDVQNAVSSGASRKSGGGGCCG